MSLQAPLLQTPLHKQSKKQLYIEASVLIGLGILACLLFYDERLDFWAARLFFHPSNANDFWLEQHHFLWSFFYHAAPWLTGILLLPSLLVLILAQFVAGLRKFRIYAAFIFLSVALGPGLVINSVFKPNWGRPRPREITEFHGKYQYRPFYVAEFGAQGKSFPCGHCSVGFVYGLFYLLLKRRKKFWAYLALIGAIVLGTFLGVGRIAAGGHFFSDVVWSALFTWGVCFWLYYFALRIPEREAGTFTSSNRFVLIQQFFQKRKSFSVVAYVCLGGLSLTALLLATPFAQRIQVQAANSQKVESFELQIQHSDIRVLLDPNQQQAFQLEGSVKGFGFPKNKVMVECEGQAKTICRIYKKGFFSDFESLLTLKLNPNLLENLQLQLQKGDVSISNDEILPTKYLISSPAK